MKVRHILFALAAVAIVVGLFGVTNTPETWPRSPKGIACIPGSCPQGPGSGHAFGYSIVYTVVDHRVHNGKTWAIVKSHEPGVEIWSPIPELVAMPVGAKFHLLKGAGSFGRALQRIPLKQV